MKKKIAITRPVNGISLNGDEFLLDENGAAMKFRGRREAEEFLLSHGESIAGKKFVEL